MARRTLEQFISQSNLKPKLYNPKKWVVHKCCGVDPIFEENPCSSDGYYMTSIASYKCPKCGRVVYVETEDYGWSGPHRIQQVCCKAYDELVKKWNEQVKKTKQLIAQETIEKNIKNFIEILKKESIDGNICRTENGDIAIRYLDEKQKKTCQIVILNQVLL